MDNSNIQKSDDDLKTSVVLRRPKPEPWKPVCVANLDQNLQRSEVKNRSLLSSILFELKDLDLNSNYPVPNFEKQQCNFEKSTDSLNSKALDKNFISNDTIDKDLVSHKLKSNWYVPILKMLKIIN